MFAPIESTSVKVILRFNGKPVATTPTQCLPDGTIFVRANDCPEYPNDGTLYMLQSSNVIAKTVTWEN